ncbi:MAG: hypothetical protein WD648_15960 [Planctomycetaceae bacterium]
MLRRTRRQFLSEVTQGMLVAAVGFEAANSLDLAPAFGAGDGGSERLTFGKLEPLVQLLQESEPARLLPEITRRLRTGTPLRDVVAATALANARTFGGEDYVGFHTLMALAPSYQMALSLPEDRRALPVLKVLYRNCNRIGEYGGPASEVLHAIALNDAAKSTADGAKLSDAIHRKDMAEAERIFARIAQGSVDAAFNELLVAVEEGSEVHRVVLPYRARNLVDLVGVEHAHTLLRQSVRYCVANESEKYREMTKGGRDVLPKLLDQYRLLGAVSTERTADDAWVASLSESIFRSTPDDAAEAVAASLAEGFSWEAIGEAISLAANQLVLRDAGRPEKQARPPEKPVGSVHGDSIGVHASDSANAWRNMARFADQRNRVACLILGAHQVAHDRASRGGDFLNWRPYPTDEHLQAVRGKTPDEVLHEAEAAIRENNQTLAASAIHRYGELGGDSHAVFSLLLGYAISEDGALHAEKYYQTVTENFAATRPSLRWRHLVSLARVTASAYGFPAAGVREAEEFLKS